MLTAVNDLNESLAAIQMSKRIAAKHSMLIPRPAGDYPASGGAN
jgi:hypothetical protein